MNKEELQKEAEEKCKKYKLAEIETYEVEAYIEGAEPREKQIEELEKENAELKRNEFNARSCLELQQSQDKAILNYMGEQLAKVKELIENIIRVTWGEGWNYSLDWKVKAEQFLKDVEQPKMSASQVPAPEPPKMEMITEDYNPLKLIKEEMKDNSRLIKESE